MAKTYYAWTNFPVAVDEFGRVNETIKTGEEVTRKQIPCTDEEWEEYITRGMVRTTPYPDAPRDISPREFYEQPLPVESVRELRMGMGLEPPAPDDGDASANPKEADDPVQKSETEGRAADSDESNATSSTGSASSVSGTQAASTVKQTPPVTGAASPASAAGATGATGSSVGTK